MISIDSLTNNSITVNYTLPSYGTISAAILHYGTSSIPITYTGNDPNSIEITGLQQLTTYSNIYIYVTYGSVIHTYLTSNIIQDTTTTGNTGISIGSITTESIQIKYTIPSSPLPINNAYLYYGTSYPLTTSSQINIQDNSYNVTISSSSTYYFYIDVSFSPLVYSRYSRSAAISGSTSSSNIISIASISNKSIKINYASLTSTSYGAVINATLYYGRMDQLTTSLSTINAGDSSYNVTNLSPSIAYYFYIYVTYQYGFNLTSNNISGTTSDDTTIRIGTITMNSIKINYVLPLSPSPTAATLYYGTSNPPTTPVQDVDIHDTSYNVTGLSSSPYYFYIDVSFSTPYSSSQYSRSNQISQSKPISNIISVATISNTSIKINYTSLTSYGTTSAATLYYGTSSQPTTYYPIDTIDSSYNFTGLSPLSTYY